MFPYQFCIPRFKSRQLFIFGQGWQRHAISVSPLFFCNFVASEISQENTHVVNLVERCAVFLRDIRASKMGRLEKLVFPGELLTRGDADGRIFPFTRVACCTSGISSDFTHGYLGRVEAETEGMFPHPSPLCKWGCSGICEIIKHIIYWSWIPINFHAIYCLSERW